MRRTTLEDFRAELTATGAYRTHADCHAPSRARSGPLTTLRLAWPVASLFHKTSLCLKLGLATPHLLDEMCFETISAAEALGLAVTFSGWENRLAHKGPVIYVCNHLSSFETIMLPPVLRTFEQYSILVKESLAHVPFVPKPAVDFMGLIPIGRKNPREDLMRSLEIGGERLRSGSCLLIFPQGSRQKVFSRKAFSSIGAKIAAHTGFPLCPLVVDTRCLPMREKGPFKRLLHDFGPADTSRDITCVCGPLQTSDNAKSLHLLTLDWMTATLRSLGLPVEES